MVRTGLSFPALPSLHLPAFLTRHDVARHLPPAMRRHPFALCGMLVALLFVLVWAAATTSYILFHDDALRLIANRASSQANDYERQISQLEAQLVEERSRKLVEQKRMEALVEQIRQRQTALEARHGLLSDLTGGTGGPSPAARPAERGAARSSSIEGAGMPAASPISDTVILAPADMREARVEAIAAPTAFAAAQTASSQEARLAEISGGLERLERRQNDALNTLEENIEQRGRRMRSVLASLGVTVPLRPTARIAQAGTGGPFVPVTAAHDAFERRSTRAREMLADFDALKRQLDAVPIRRPVPGSVETSSGFGVRLDPFLRQAAYHTGIDFRGTTGDPARVTAAGKVVSAGREGGYGLMVEVDHGNGLSTRYAHLSAISVSVGDTLAIGAVVGRIGSTGRSTGPHLHYETRIKGEPVDPQRFLRAGLRIADGA